MQFRNVKSVEVQKEFSSTDIGYFWLYYPHLLNFQEILRVRVYCPFKFGNYPFDQHECNFTFGMSGNTIDGIALTPAKIRHAGKEITYGDEPLTLHSKRLPFDIKLSSIKAWPLKSDGAEYAFCGMNIRFTRQGLGVLIGSFYAPTAIFALLSMISFNIHPDIVSLFT